MKFQHAYSEPFRGSDLECKDVSLTQQNFKDETDINVLLERFKVTGVMPAAVRLPSYGDFTGVNDFRTAMDAVRNAMDGFMALPANLRARFENDPQRLLEFLSDENNRDEAVKLGLLKAQPGQPTVSSENVSPGVSGA